VVAQRAEAGYRIGFSPKARECFCEQHALDWGQIAVRQAKKLPRELTVFLRAIRQQSHLCEREADAGNDETFQRSDPCVAIVTPREFRRDLNRLRDNRRLRRAARR
jgi:hypothetical protein